MKYGNLPNGTILPVWWAAAICLFRYAGDADRPHELIDSFIPGTIPAGICIGVRDRVTEGEVQICRVNGIAADVLLTTVGALGPDHDFALYLAWIRRVGDIGIRGVVSAIHILHGLDFVGVGDWCGFFCGGGGSCLGGHVLG